MTPDASQPRPKTAKDENFPVGSWLLPEATRPTVAAFYRFARAADDIADDPARGRDAKVAALLALDAILAGAAEAPEEDAPAMAAQALRDALAGTTVPIDHARHLLQAFQWDAESKPVRGWSDLLLYCRYSAAPVGRFLLDLHGEREGPRGPADALCASLQILNHLQDLKADWETLERSYLPLDWLRAAGLGPDAVLDRRCSPALRGVLNRVLDGVDRLNQQAAPLPLRMADRRLAFEAAVILAFARRLAAKLRRRDPIARRVAMGRIERAAWAAAAVVRTWLARRR